MYTKSLFNILFISLTWTYLIKFNYSKSIHLARKRANQNETELSNKTLTPLITETEFKNALNAAGYRFSDGVMREKYENLIAEAEPSGHIESKRELAMFLAQIVWESDGLRAKREYACANGCPEEYKSDLDHPGQSYYGRGYIQLTWAYNYIAASKDIFNDDRLLKDPDMVARDDRVAWATAFWFWRKNVKKLEGISRGEFGHSTRMINGILECDKGPNVHKAKIRFELYRKILKEFNVQETPKEDGCYELKE